MGTKTISLKDETYKRLKGCRRYLDESFSEVVLRATWPADTITARAFARADRPRQVHLRTDELDRIEPVTERESAS